MRKANPPPEGPIHRLVRDSLKGQGRDIGITVFLREGTVGPVKYLIAATVGYPVSIEDLNRPLAMMAEFCAGHGDVSVVPFCGIGENLRLGRVVVEDEDAPDVKSAVIVLYPGIRVAVSRLKNTVPLECLPFQIPRSEAFGGSRAV